jgi:hypothetical protein
MKPKGTQSAGIFAIQMGNENSAFKHERKRFIQGDTLDTPCCRAPLTEKHLESWRKAQCRGSCSWDPRSRKATSTMSPQ